MNLERDIVYVIDPDEAVDDALTILLGAAGARVECYPNAEAFFDSRIAHKLRRGCLLVEANLPGMGCLAFLKRLRTQCIYDPVLILTSTSNRDIANQALMAGAAEIIEKPLVGSRLLNRLHYWGHYNENVGVELNG